MNLIFREMSHVAERGVVGPVGGIGLRGPTHVVVPAGVRVRRLMVKIRRKNLARMTGSCAMQPSRGLLPSDSIH
jgi:hypothetical protein